MIDPTAVRQNLDEWLQNPTWKELYDGAPSAACRKYIAMDFYASETEEDEAFDELDRMLEALDAEDLKYLYNGAEGPEKKRFAQLIAQKQG